MIPRCNPRDRRIREPRMEPCMARMRGVRAPYRRTAHTAHPPIRGCAVGCAVGGANLAPTAHRPAGGGGGVVRHQRRAAAAVQDRTIPHACTRLSRYPTRTPPAGSGHVHTHVQPAPAVWGPLTAVQGQV
jgi:hypothetical protein